MAMQYSDRVGYDVLLSLYSVICKSSLDPSDLARSLLQSRIINQGILDQVGSRAAASQCEKIGTLLDAVLRSGAPDAFEFFVTAIKSDGSADWLVTQLKGNIGPLRRWVTAQRSSFRSDDYRKRKRPPQVESDGDPLTPDPNTSFRFPLSTYV